MSSTSTSFRRHGQPIERRPSTIKNKEMSYHRLVSLRKRAGRFSLLGDKAKEQKEQLRAAGHDRASAATKRDETRGKKRKAEHTEAMKPNSRRKTPALTSARCAELAKACNPTIPRSATGQLNLTKSKKVEFGAELTKEYLALECEAREPPIPVKRVGRGLNTGKVASDESLAKLLSRLAEYHHGAALDLEVEKAAGRAVLVPKMADADWSSCRWRKPAVPVAADADAEEEAEAGGAAGAGTPPS